MVIGWSMGLHPPPRELFAHRTLRSSKARPLWSGVNMALSTGCIAFTQPFFALGEWSLPSHPMDRVVLRKSVSGPAYCIPQPNTPLQRALVHRTGIRAFCSTLGIGLAPIEPYGMNGVANATAGPLGLLGGISSISLPNSESLEPSLHLGQPFHPRLRDEQGVSRCEMGERIFTYGVIATVFLSVL